MINNNIKYEYQDELIMYNTYGEDVIVLQFKWVEWGCMNNDLYSCTKNNEYGVMLRRIEVYI